jgi:23S rRNA (uracil1939-C5)-methyltransferase
MRTMCCHFPQCGGCTILDKSYDNQLALKKDALSTLFKNWEKIGPSIIKCPELHYYRHKVQLPFSIVRSGKKTKIGLGCFAKESHIVVDQKECFIQDKALTIVAYGVREWAGKARMTVYNESSGKGFLRHVLLRRGAGTGEILIGLVTNGGRPDGSRFLSKMLLDIVQARLGQMGTIVGIVQNVNIRDTNVVLGTIENVWWGRPYIKELLGTLKFKLEMSTFFQVNPYQTPNLYNEVLRNIPDASRVLDLYSGVGSISLWLASKAKEVVGIEENKISISAAKTAASLNQIKNVRFVAGDVTELLPDFTRSGFECAVIDPPRKGIDRKSVDSIMESTLKRLVYVSCNPQTLARDVALMAKKYRLVSLTGVDMFPHTDHIEAVGVLDRL